jgi:hypothetical protein
LLRAAPLRPVGKRVGVIRGIVVWRVRLRFDRYHERATKQSRHKGFSRFAPLKMRERRCRAMIPKSGTAQRWAERSFTDRRLPQTYP